MRIPIDSNSFVCQLSIENQNKVKKLVSEYLVKEGYNQKEIDETIENVMNDRLWNIEEAIDITPFFIK